MKIVDPIRQPEKIEQIKNILKKQKYRDYFLFLFGINTGLRISDILNLRVLDIKDKIYINIIEKKTGKLKRFKINNSLRHEIEIYIDDMEEGDYLFKSRKGGNSPINRSTAYAVLNEAAKKAGLDHIGTHTLRKTFGYHFYQRTKDIAMLQTIFNHSSPSITLRYIGINQDMQDQALETFSL